MENWHKARFGKISPGKKNQNCSSPYNPIKIAVVLMTLLAVIFVCPLVCFHASALEETNQFKALEETNPFNRPFSDITETNWAYDAVTHMSERGIVSGYPDGSFKPDQTVTCAEFIKMALVASTGEDVGNAGYGNWAINYYNEALERSYFTAYDIPKTSLNTGITRAHMALIISSILGDVAIEDYDLIQKGISDITYQTEYEYDITKAYAFGVLTGYTDSTFKPDKTLTRVEAATVIYRLAEESKREYPDVSGSTVTQKPLEEVITNLYSFINDGDGSINEDLPALETYEIVPDGAKYKMELRENRGTTWIYIPPETAGELHLIFLMRDGKIVEHAMLDSDIDGSDVAAYDSDMSQIDYIVSVDAVDHHAMLIVNPFQN